MLLQAGAKENIVSAHEISLQHAKESQVSADTKMINTEEEVAKAETEVCLIFCFINIFHVFRASSYLFVFSWIRLTRSQLCARCQKWSRPKNFPHKSAIKTNAKMGLAKTFDAFKILKNMALPAARNGSLVQ